MKKSYCFPAFLLFVLLSVSCQKKEETLEETFKKSVEWMWAQQSEDGGWHSKTHAVLRDGSVLTPYILFYLLQVHEDIYQADTNSIDKAIDFIIREMQMAMSEDSSALVDYPNYSAAYALRALNTLGIDRSFEVIIGTYLINQQFMEHRGITTDNLAYGGWGYGEANLKSAEHGHVDISHTRRIVEVLTEISNSNGLSGTRPEIGIESKEGIIMFLKGVQRSGDDDRLYEGCLSRSGLPYDGGFVSSVVTLSTVKSKPVEVEGAGIHYPSYATATCDGFLTMHALGMQDSISYKDAVQWLIKHQDMHTIDGLSKDDPGQWAEIMHYYHFAVRAEAMSIIDPDGKWKEILSSLLINEQQPEGFYINPIGGVNKEDDPLMATIFCIQAGTKVLNLSM